MIAYQKPTDEILLAEKHTYDLIPLIFIDEICKQKNCFNLALSLDNGTQDYTICNSLLIRITTL